MAIQGFAEAVRHERHMRFHLFAAAVVLALAAFLRLGRSDWLWLLLAIAGVWSAELLNTAIERVVDLSVEGLHPLAKAAKDTAAAAVLVMAAFALVVGLSVLGPPLLKVCFG
jgi:diacylglycerol kinase